MSWLCLTYLLLGVVGTYRSIASARELGASKSALGPREQVRHTFSVVVHVLDVIDFWHHDCICKPKYLQPWNLKCMCRVMSLRSRACSCNYLLRIYVPLTDISFYPFHMPPRSLTRCFRSFQIHCFLLRCCCLLKLCNRRCLDI